MTPDCTSSTAATSDTRERILAAAAEIFAAAGYDRATIRRVCSQAQVNVAAVNYHFGGKNRLYEAVLHHAYQLALQRYPLNLGVPLSADPRQRLRAFVQALLLRMLSPGPAAHHGQLLAREMVDPTPALDTFVREDLQEWVTTLREILRQLLGPASDERTIRLCGMSIVSQALFYHSSRAMIARLFPDLALGPESVPALTDHIVRFSLAGIEALAAPSRRLKRARPRAR